MKDERISRQPVPELVELVRALARAQAEADVARWLAKQDGSARQAAA